MQASSSIHIPKVKHISYEEREKRERHNKYEMSRRSPLYTYNAMIKKEDQPTLTESEFRNKLQEEFQNNVTVAEVTKIRSKRLKEEIGFILIDDIDED